VPRGDLPRGRVTVTGADDVALVARSRSPPMSLEVEASQVEHSLLRRAQPRRS
jgi:hypothetical protein